jgi:small-conductance mechanosensitive channel
MTRIHSELTSAGIEIPFPQQDLRLRSISSQARAALARPAKKQAAEEGDAAG